MTLLKSTECIRGSAPPPPTHARAPPENLLPCAEAAVPALRPSGQLLLRCAGSRTSVEEVLIPRSNCRPTRCSQNVSEVPVVTDTTCRLHSISLLRRALAPSPTHPFPPPPLSSGSWASAFAERKHAFKNITHFCTSMLPPA